VRLATRAEGGGGVNVGAIIGESLSFPPLYHLPRHLSQPYHVAGVIFILGALVLIFVKTRNRNRNLNPNRAVQQYYPSQKQSIFALGPSKPAPQPLPLYTQPTSPYAQQYNGGLPMPQAVHPSTSGYYRQAGQVQQDDRVRFGPVGVVRY
jgi:hypothetical protein